MDTNQFANSGGGSQPQAQPQSAPITTPVNGVAAMIKAMMDGNDAFKQQAGNAPALAPGSQVPGTGGPTAVGGPMGPSPLTPTPPVNPGAMAGGVGSGMSMTPQGTMSGMPMGGGNFGTGMSPFSQGGSPVSMDPVTQALMSPIPGMNNG